MFSLMVTLYSSLSNSGRLSFMSTTLTTTYWESNKMKIKVLSKSKTGPNLYLCCSRLAASPNLLSDHLGKSKVSSQEGCVLNFENAKLKFKQVYSLNLCDWGQSWVAQQWQMIDGGCDSNLDTFAILLLFPIYSKFGHTSTLYGQNQIESL